MNNADGLSPEMVRQIEQKISDGVARGLTAAAAHRTQSVDDDRFAFFKNPLVGWAVTLLAFLLVYVFNQVESAPSANAAEIKALTEDIAEFRIQMSVGTAQFATLQQQFEQGTADRYTRTEAIADMRTQYSRDTQQEKDIEELKRLHGRRE